MSELFECEVVVAPVVFPYPLIWRLYRQVGVGDRVEVAWGGADSKRDARRRARAAKARVLSGPVVWVLDV